MRKGCVGRTGNTVGTALCTPLGGKTKSLKLKASSDLERLQVIGLFTFLTLQYHVPTPKCPKYT